MNERIEQSAALFFEAFTKFYDEMRSFERKDAEHYRQECKILIDEGTQLDAIWTAAICAMRMSTEKCWDAARLVYLHTDLLERECKRFCRMISDGDAKGVVKEISILNRHLAISTVFHIEFMRCESARQLASQLESISEAGAQYEGV